MDDWLERVTDWLAVWSGQPVHSSLPGARLTIPGDRLALWPVGSDGTWSPKIRGRGPISVSLFPGEPVTGTQWKRATQFAAYGSDPPLGYLLLREAHQELFRDELRRSLVEAGTAAEVALNQALDTKFTAVGGERHGQGVLRIARGITDLSELAHCMGLDLPSRTQIREKLAESRNRAVHQAKDPAPEVAERAVDVAGDVVGALIALPR